MFNATIKIHSIILATATAGSIVMQSCSDNASAKASELLSQAKEAFETNSYEQVIKLTDSIRHAYPSQIDIRREALHLATRATECITLEKLEQADSILAVLNFRADSVAKYTKKVDNIIGAYYIAASANPEAAGKVNGLHARISPEGDFYIISTLTGTGVKSTSVSVNCNGQTASTSVIEHDGERNDRSMGAEKITFIGSECDSVGSFIEKNCGTPMTISFNGASTKTIPLPNNQADEIATLYRAAKIAREAKVATIEKERLSRALDIARSQAARTFPDKETENN